MSGAIPLLPLTPTWRGPGKRYLFYSMTLDSCGPGSVVGIETAYGLDGPEIESRWGARFSAPVQTGLLCNGYRVFPGGEVRPGRDADPSLPSTAEVKKKSKAIPLPSLRAFVAYERVKPTYIGFIARWCHQYKILINGTRPSNGKPKTRYGTPFPFVWMTPELCRKTQTRFSKWKVT
jgi:hypothetical protein